VHDARSIKEFVLARPTFFEHFDGVLVDGRYLWERDKRTVAQEAGWIGRQGLRVYVDVTSSINLYPDLRLVENIEADYEASRTLLEDMLEKMEALGARGLILSLHRVPENNITRKETWESFEKTLRWLCDRARERDVTVHLRTSLKAGRSLEDVLDLINRVNAPNLLLAPSAALLLHEGRSQELLERNVERIGLWLLASPDSDAAGALWTCNAPLAGVEQPRALLRYLRCASKVPWVLDAVYSSWDEEYRDANVLRALASEMAQ
jgi:hypothetical protein